MLRALTIRDFVIVDALEIDFSSGFTVFSGETGAGKSILIDALALALGERSDASVVREGAQRADITAEFAPGEMAMRWLTEQAWDQPDGLLLRRVVDSQGRSKSWINGFPATLGQMRELGDLLVDIHGQHAHQRLLRAPEQRLLLDEQAQLGDRVAKVATEHRNWQKHREQRLRFEQDARQLMQEREHLEWQVKELSELGLGEGEWDGIQQEHQRLAHAQALIDGAEEAIDALAESETALLDRLTSVQHRLAQLAAIDPALAASAEALESGRILALEAVHGVRAYLDRVELDPERLAVLESRIEAIHGSARKFKVAPGELPALLTRASERLEALSGASDLATLRALEEAGEQAFQRAAQSLSKARAKAAHELAQAVTEAMQSLSMAGGRFAIALLPAEPSSHGLETVEFQVATHPGATPRPLAKVASGGELARISLALSVVSSTSKTVPTLIFDEVDSGIGGAVAEVVGRLLRQLGRHCQVLCVTHLAQVAAQTEHHFAVNKVEVDGKTLSRIATLDAPSRIDELARMLGGIAITATTRKHARELLAAVS